MAKYTARYVAEACGHEMETLQIWRHIISRSQSTIFSFIFFLTQYKRKKQRSGYARLGDAFEEQSQEHPRTTKNGKNNP